jgi:hypothetical protein
VQPCHTLAHHGFTCHDRKHDRDTVSHTSAPPHTRPPSVAGATTSAPAQSSAAGAVPPAQSRRPGAVTPTLAQSRTTGAATSAQSCRPGATPPSLAQSRSAGAVASAQSRRPGAVPPNLAQSRSGAAASAQFRRPGATSSVSLPLDAGMVLGTPTHAGSPTVQHRHCHEQARWVGTELQLSLPWLLVQFCRQLDHSIASGIQKKER